MKKEALFFLFLTGCINEPDMVLYSNVDETKTTLVIGHVQSLKSSIIPDSSKTGYGLLMVDRCFNPEACERSIDKSMNDFADTGVENCRAAFLSWSSFNYTPINNDVGGGLQQKKIYDFPFTSNVTRYNRQDSCRLIIDSIDGSGEVYLRVGAKSYQIKTGEEIEIVDTLMARQDSTRCWQQLIITQTVVNYGLSSLLDRKFRVFFVR